jgi:hypothetical protein
MTPVRRKNLEARAFIATNTTSAVRPTRSIVARSILGLAAIAVACLVPASAAARDVPVATVEALRAAITDAEPGDVILVADGDYRVERPIYFRDRHDVVLRSASDDPTRVRLLGRDFGTVSDDDDIIRIASSTNIRIESLTFEDAHTHGIKVESESEPSNTDIHIHNCHFRNIGQRMIKGSTSPTGVSLRGSVTGCHFENTRIPPATWQSGGNYITAIDMMSLEDWTFSDNVFVNIRGASGEARAAIFIWNRSRRIVIERNLMIHCDRGIGVGNASGTEGTVHVTDAIVRNNRILTGTDAGIEVARVSDVRLYNNTIWREDPGGRGIRFIELIDGSVASNNLVRGSIALIDGATESNNLTGSLDGYFVDPEGFDLDLTSAAIDAIDHAIVLADVTDDFHGAARGAMPDIGSHELGAAPGIDAGVTRPEDASFAETDGGTTPGDGGALDRDAGTHSDGGPNGGPDGGPDGGTGTPGCGCGVAGGQQRGVSILTAALALAALARRRRTRRALLV